MVSYQGEAAPAWPDRPDVPIQSSGRRAATPTQVASIIAISAWLTVSVPTLFYMYKLGQSRLDLAQSRMGAGSLWFQQGNWVETAFLIPTALAIAVIVLRLQLITKVTALILLFAAMIGASAVAMTGYVMLSDGQVLIHSPLPWRHDVRFGLADARVTARGCHFWRSKNGTHHHIIFDVQGAPGRGETVNLGDAAERHNLGPWLALMRGYDNGPLPLPAAAGANQPHDSDCMQFWLSDLAPQQQAEFTHLLS